jgi:hypothetical protein
MRLAPDEKAVAEAPFGFGPLGGNAILTNRRIVLEAGDMEESIPLSALTSVRAGFMRNPSGAFWGALLLAVAVGFAAAYKPLETAVNTLGMAIEKRMNDKPLEGEAYGRYIYIGSGVIWMLMLPLIGWGGYKLASGVIGETELVIATASGELRRSARGRREELLEFGAEVGARAGR